MDNRELYDAMMSTMWQDYKGFFRIEKEQDDERHYHLYTFLFAIVFGGILWIFADVLECPPVLFAIPIVFIPKLLFDVFLKDIPRAKIRSNAYDIEVTTSQYKLIRNKKKKIGLCKWEKYTSCRLLLKSQYDIIERTDNVCFIVARKKTISRKTYYGIYNAEKKRITVPVKYDSITRPKNTADLYEVEKNGVVEKFNSYGDRIIR